MTEIANGIKTRRTASSRSILRQAWSTLSTLGVGGRRGTRNASRRSRAPRFFLILILNRRGMEPGAGGG